MSLLQAAQSSLSPATTSELRLLLADIVLVLHFLFVCFVVLSVPVIWIGFFWKKSFVRNLSFRTLHLLAMGFVLVESLLGFLCPLTIWESILRSSTGPDGIYQGSFVQYWLQRVIFYEASETVFKVVYVLFFFLIVASWFIVKPERKSKVR